MIQLRETVHIDRSPEAVWAWLSDLPTHYRAWHPAHGRCWYERGSALERGAVLSVEETLHGRVHHLTLRATDVVPHRLLRYASRGLRGEFLLEAEEGGTRFTATLAFGVDAPLVGSMLDRVLGPMFEGRLAELRSHMREEGRNLKVLLERDR